MRPPLHPLPLALLATLTAAALPGADAPAARSWPRLIGQALVGTAGFEPGVAAEWTFPGAHPLRLRPELFLNDRPRPGIAGSVSWGVLGDVLPAGHELFIGPRLAYHNNRHDHDGRRDDDHDLHYGFEFGAVGFYVFPIVPSQPGRHWIEIIAAPGIVDSKDDWDPAITVGAAYGYAF